MPTVRDFAMVHGLRAAERRSLRRERRRVREADRTRFAQGGGRTSRVLVNDPLNPSLLASRSNGMWRRLVVRLFASRLDRQLACGLPPETNGLVAARAHYLVSPLTRRDLAEHWQAVMAGADRPPVMRDPRVPLCRDRIAGARDEVHAMLRDLVAPLPVAARGVAMVGLLLHDGAGPLYNRRSETDLGAALRAAAAQLDPAMALAPPG